MNVVVTVATADIAIVHLFGVPVTGVQFALKLPKFELASAAAVSVTVVGFRKLAVQVDPQLIPDGEDVTIPEPVPINWTVSVGAMQSRS